MLKEITRYFPVPASTNYFSFITGEINFNTISPLDDNDVVVFENSQFEAYLKTTIEPQLISLSVLDTFEFGQKNSSTLIFEEQFKKNEHVAIAWLSQFYADYVRDAKIIHLIAHSLEATTSSSIDKLAKPIALAMLSYDDVRIKEYGVKFFEKNATRENLDILKKTKTGTAWLDDYIARVINDFEEELG